jgi:hypothetical protein
MPAGMRPGRIFLGHWSARSGITMNAISKKSMKHAEDEHQDVDNDQEAPAAARHFLSNRCSTQIWPSAALKVKLKTVEPIRMNITNVGQSGPWCPGPV